MDFQILYIDFGRRMGQIVVVLQIQRAKRGKLPNSLIMGRNTHGRLGAPSPGTKAPQSIFHHSFGRINFHPTQISPITIAAFLL